MAHDEWGHEDGHGDLQALVDALFSDGVKRVDRIDALVLAQAHDLNEDVLSVVERLPPVTMNRAQLTDQINSTLAARGWGRRFGIVS